MSPGFKKSTNTFDTHSMRSDMKLPSNKFNTDAAKGQASVDDSQIVRDIKDNENEMAIKIKEGGKVSIYY